MPPTFLRMITTHSYDASCHAQGGIGFADDSGESAHDKRRAARPHHSNSWRSLTYVRDVSLRQYCRLLKKFSLQIDAEARRREQAIDDVASADACHSK